MNALAEKYGDKINILAFPCNQFGHQTNEGNDEFLNTIKYVRPGNGFEIAPSITVFEKTDVNGASAHPLFKWMKSEIMIPVSDGGDGCLVDTQDNGCADADALILPRGGFGGTTVTLWSPVSRSDIAWNFEARHAAGRTLMRLFHLQVEELDATCSNGQGEGGVRGVRRGVQCVEGAGERRRGLLAGRACTPHRVRLHISEDGRTGVWG